MTWTKDKGKLTWACRACLEDSALPEEDRFGIMRGFDIRKEGRGPRYCRTCGVEHSVHRRRV